MPRGAHWSGWKTWPIFISRSSCRRTLCMIESFEPSYAASNSTASTAARFSSASASARSSV